MIDVELGEYLKRICHALEESVILQAKSGRLQERWIEAYESTCKRETENDSKLVPLRESEIARSIERHEIEIRMLAEEERRRAELRTLRNESK